MATIRHKRRAAGGAAGAPTSLATTELAYNETDDVAYIGYGDNGAGVATSVRAVFGAGVFATKEYVDTAVATSEASSVAWTNVTGTPTTLVGYGITDATPSSHIGSGGTAHADVIAAGASGFMSGADKTKLNGIEAGADVTDAVNVGSSINGAVAKTTPVSADKLALIDSAATNTLKNITYSNLLNAMQTAITAAIVDSSPATLDTLNELAAALGDDPNFATTINNSLAAKAPLASPTFTGNPTAPTAAASDNDTTIATTAHVKAAIAAATIDGGTF